LDEARQTLNGIIKESNRASVIGRLRALVKKAPARKDRLDINEAILEVVAPTRGEGVRNDVLLQTQLANNLLLIPGDRIQLQQVMLSLIINDLDAMSGVSEGSRELLITSAKEEPTGALVAVRDSGRGLDWTRRA
jgi:C4-dicarboxylate-specific signal transduction histidine kinase